MFFAASRCADETHPKPHPAMLLELADGQTIESVLLGAWRTVLAEGRDRVTGADLARAFADFLPSAQGLEREAQEHLSECINRFEPESIFLPFLLDDHDAFRNRLLCDPYVELYPFQFLLKKPIL